MVAVDGPSALWLWMASGHEALLYGLGGSWGNGCRDGAAVSALISIRGSLVPLVAIGALTGLAPLLSMYQCARSSPALAVAACDEGTVCLVSHGVLIAWQLGNTTR